MIFLAFLDNFWSPKHRNFSCFYQQANRPKKGSVLKANIRVSYGKIGILLQSNRFSVQSNRFGGEPVRLKHQELIDDCLFHNIDPKERQVVGGYENEEIFDGLYCSEAFDLFHDFILHTANEDQTLKIKFDDDMFKDKAKLIEKLCSSKKKADIH